MKFLELMEKYKNGQATEEEKKYIEEEIEKNEIINEYLAEQYNFDELKTDETKKESYIEYKVVKKSVNRKLLFIIGISVALVFLIIFFTKYLVSPVVSSMYYNPNSESVGQEFFSDFTFDLSAVVEASYPGYIARSIIVSDEGFGKYDIYFSINNLFTDKVTNINATIEKNRFIGISNDLFLRNQDMFNPWFLNFLEDSSSSNDEYFNKKHNEFKIEKIDHLKQLPSTSYVSTYVAFENPVTLNQLVELKKKYININFDWLSVKTSDDGKGPNVGFRIETNGGTSSGSVPNEKKYPGLQLSSAFTLVKPSETFVEDVYEMHCMSLFKYLSDRKEATKVITGGGSSYDYKSIYKYLEQNGILIEGVLMFSETYYLTEFLDNEKIMDIYIDDVLPSKFAGRTMK